jgi:hypothetical protein
MISSRLADLTEAIHAAKTRAKWHKPKIRSEQPD